MKRLITPLKLSVLLSLLIFSSGYSVLSWADTQPLDPAGIQSLSIETAGKSEVKLNRSHGGASFVDIAPDQTGSLIDFKGKTPKDTSDQFLKNHGALFGLKNPSTELKLSKQQSNALGTLIIYQQLYNGLPVEGAKLISNVTPSGDLRSVNGRVIPNLSLNTTPSITSQKAAAIAQKYSDSKLNDDDSINSASAVIGNPQLVVFNPSIYEDRPGASYLAWKIKLRSANGAENIFIDAVQGTIVGEVNLHMNNLTRRAYDAVQQDINDSSIPKNYPKKPFWTEGDIFPTTQPFALPSPAWQSTNDALAATKVIYDLYNNTFGIDAPDGLGTKMDVILNYGMGNAFSAEDRYPYMFTAYGLDLATDDVVSHEWQHWYTSFSGGGLDYLNQGGALHEAYSDIFGEVVDFMNIGMPFGGTDIPNNLRHDGMCSLFSINDPAARTPKLIINSPASIASEILEIGLPSFGPLLPTSGITADAAYVDDGSTAVDLSAELASIHDGCQIPFVTNVAGKIALIQRGNCTYVSKVLNAQSQGAVGVVIINYDDLPVGMGGSSSEVQIPSLMIGKIAGNTILNALTTSPVNLTMKAEQEPRYTDNSVRWINGEDAGGGQGYGLAGRDLWDPTCLGLPGKVSDPQYYCGTGDLGGAHTNMGVVTHAFALLVDGGNYNGQSISALGLTKATAIYQRAQNAYQFPTMDFSDHADALEQACGDLKGKPLKILGSNQISSEVIKQADCLSVHKAMLAVEMRSAPSCLVQIGFAISADKVAVIEGQTGITPMTFTVRLSAISPLPISVDYEAVGLTASSGTDFLPTKGTLVIPAGQQTATITIPIKGDLVPEPDEILVLQLSNPVNAEMSSGSLTGKILNDD